MRVHSRLSMVETLHQFFAPDEQATRPLAALRERRDCELPWPRLISIMLGRFQRHNFGGSHSCGKVLCMWVVIEVCTPWEGGIRVVDRRKKGLTRYTGVLYPVPFTRRRRALLHDRSQQQAAAARPPPPTPRLIKKEQCLRRGVGEPATCEGPERVGASASGTCLRPRPA